MHDTVVDPTTAAHLLASLQTPPAPALTPIPELPSSPSDPWDLPEQGLRWCDCGEDCPPPGRDVAEGELLSMGYGEGDAVPHLAVIAACQKMWSYETVCAFFTDHVDLSAQRVNGKVEQAYSFGIAVDIIGYFSRTWQGCPEEVCDDERTFL